jgi:hypothetical protein
MKRDHLPRRARDAHASGRRHEEEEVCVLSQALSQRRSAGPRPPPSARLPMPPTRRRSCRHELPSQYRTFSARESSRFLVPQRRENGATSIILNECLGGSSTNNNDKMMILMIMMNNDNILRGAGTTPTMRSSRLGRKASTSPRHLGASISTTSRPAVPAPGNIHVMPLRFKLGGRPVLSARLNVETARSERKTAGNLNYGVS